MRIALTGGIASGKSTVSQWFSERGVPVIDCDALVHSSYNEGGQMYLAVLDAFGPRILNEEGQIDRKKLSEIVFKDEVALKCLSDITHPIVRALVEKQANDLEAEGYSVIIVDIPLLYESGMAQQYEKVIVVHVPFDLQLKRLMERNQFSEEEARRRIQSQMNLDDKAKMANYVISNAGSLIELYDQLEQLLESLKR